MRVFGFLMAGALLLAGCAGQSNPDPAHNARNALDWAGAYRGVLPCADCPGIETVVVLHDDGRYETHARYQDRNAAPLMGQGRFTWNAAGNTVTLSGGSGVEQYFVAENRLIRLAIDGTRITGQLADNYVLPKIGEGVTERYWKLVELRGQPVPPMAREPYMILKAEGNQVNGFAGCNGFGGRYEVNEATLRIRFDQLMGTMMACMDGMETETAFHEVLRSADNYALNGDQLVLNRARMAPLARFEAVYLR